MDHTNKEEMDRRQKRISDTVELKMTDRVPFVPQIGNFYALGYGLTIQEVMEDITALIPVMEQYVKKYDPDMVYAPGFYPADALESAEYSNARWPGDFHHLPENTPYQFIDREYMEEDNYEEYLRDPSGFLFNRVLPQKYRGFEGLAYLKAPVLCGQAIFRLAALGLAPVREALQRMIKTGEALQKNLTGLSKVNSFVKEMGYPLLGDSVMVTPFDDFADNVRGLIAAIIDMKTDPQRLNEVLLRWGDVTIPAGVSLAKRSGSKFVFIPLHCGADNFMSLDNYNRYYWPHLKRLIMALIDEGLVPVPLCEGKYTSRLETLTDVPAGKVIYFFEDVDLKRAKTILSGHACFGAGMKTQLLLQGSDPGAVTEETKRTLDICAPGGGFIMTNSLSMDNVEHSCFEAWRDAVRKYGVY